MCGIFAYYNKNGFMFDKKFIDKLNNQVSKLDHRGYSSKKYIVNNKLYLYHRRLAINDLSQKGDQPFYINGIFCIINGEIYNYDELVKLVDGYKFKSSSDCEILIPLYNKFGTQFISKLNGMFSFVLYDSKKNIFMAGRDHIGITSLYYAKKDNSIMFSSEMKVLTELSDDIQNFTPGNIFINNDFFNYYKPEWKNKLLENSIEVNYEDIKNKLIESVKLHTKSDVPIGVLLSGGLDSSLITSIMCKLKKNGEIPFDIKTFTIGVENSSDIIAAEKVAEYLNTEHTSYNFDADDAINVLDDVIYSLETYDITTIRASIPLYLLTMWIKEDTDIKVILSAEVADEIFGGYLYFHKAPNSQEFLDEIVDKMTLLNKYDLLRAHKISLANALELRVPFAHKPFVDYAMNIDTEKKMINANGDNNIEKYILRKSFDDGTYLPNEILWRIKEQFSDGVSSETENVISKLQQYSNKTISDDEFNNKSILFPVNTPITKEGFLYRKIFESKFPHASCITTVDHNTKSVSCSTERALRWLGLDENSEINDPSGRSMDSLI